MADDGESFVKVSGEGRADVVDGWELELGEVTDLLGGNDGLSVLGADTVHEDVVEKVLDDVAVVVYEALVVDAKVIRGPRGSDWVSDVRKSSGMMNSQECFGNPLEIYHPVLRRAGIVEFTACLVAAEHDIGGVDISNRRTIKILQCLVVHPPSECFDGGVDTSKRQVLVEYIGTLFIQLASGTVALDARLNSLCKWASTLQSVRESFTSGRCITHKWYNCSISSL